MTTHGVSIGDKWLEAVEGLVQPGQQLDALRERLAVRVTRDHPAAQAFAAANDAFVAVYSPISYLAKFGRDEGAETLKESRQEVSAAAESFERHRHESMNQAVALVGADVDE
jgi:ribosomal protein L18